MRVLLIIVPLFFYGLVTTAQESETDWEVTASITLKDRATISALAQVLGIGRLRKVSLDFPYVSGCPAVLLESAVRHEALRRVWSEVRLVRQGSSVSGQACSDMPNGVDRVQLGQWISTEPELNQQERWRIADGEWHVDVRLGADVAYESAELIVQAFHRHAVINRLPSQIGPVPLNTSMPDVDAGLISSVEKEPDGSNRYRLRTANGLWLLVELVGDGRTELVRYGTWTA